MKKLFLFFTLTIFSLISCEQEDLNNPNNPDKSITKTININDTHLKNGMLVFNSMSELDETANNKNLVNEKMRSRSINSTEFRSQKDIFDQIIIEEDKYEEKYLQVSDAELKKINPDTAHSQLYLEMRKKGVIKEFFEEDGMSYDYAICDPMYASVINENGLVAVEDTVYYIDAEKAVCWKNADFNNLKILKSVVATDSIRGIYVLFQKNLTKSTPADEVWQEIKYADGYRDGKKYKYAMHLHFQILEWLGNHLGPNRDEISISYKYYISLKSKKKKPLGGYKYRVSQMEFTGSTSSTASVYPRDGFTQNIPVSNGVSEYYKGGVGNSISRLNFFGPVKADIWTWDSTHILSFSRGSEELYYHNINTNYEYKGAFEGGVNVQMSGAINIQAYNRSVTY